VIHLQPTNGSRNVMMVSTGDVRLHPVVSSHGDYSQDRESDLPVFPKVLGNTFCPKGISSSNGLRVLTSRRGISRLERCSGTKIRVLSGDRRPGWGSGVRIRCKPTSVATPFHTPLPTERGGPFHDDDILKHKDNLSLSKLRGRARILPTFLRGIHRYQQRHVLVWMAQTTKANSKPRGM